MPDITSVAINGRFLTQSLTGVQRYAREVTKALDARIARGDVPTNLKSTRWRLIVPEGVQPDFPLTSIALDPYGKGDGHKWEQTSLAVRARGDRLVGYGGSGPLLHRRQIVVIHDVTIFRHPKSFGRSYRAFHTVLGNVLTRTAKIVTISEFSRGELNAVFRLPEDKMSIVRNAVDHFAALEPDESIVGRLGLESTPFFLIVGTLKPNKNVDFALRAFAVLGADLKLVVVGSTDPKVFRDGARAAQANIVYAGRLDDREIVALQRKATAFLFPSLYEGFGIPPLEAMSQGCPVLAANIPSVKEACGDAALYFDPTNLPELTEAMRRVSTEPGLRQQLTTKGEANIRRFSWDRSASDLLDVLSST